MGIPEMIEQRNRISRARTVMNRIVITCLFLIRAAIANAENWTEKSSTDRLTGKRIVEMRTDGHGLIQQFGRTVTSQLVLACTHPDDGSADYLSVKLFFSERVAIDKTRGRYRFDSGPVRDVNIFPDHRGIYFVLSASMTKWFIQQLRTSSKLRIEVNLPWAGDPLIEFDIAGAGAAMDRVPCRPPRSLL
jgi:hypothetical protein